ncbi:hypothetical protein CBR_g38804 [Chara braunii]|uniref:SMP-30/Gluconolactonase/LRE-like region domain-containing protein n=1 Tax=Chara braunii TaxID=69332 RepID=A0A388LQQ2_CHABU|nr:hypothetical protein CBR_g38804 [Chara braunii]|eukprot:GBG84522.1 hypothetical protein CBR_g38804 [Chara braunii]
MFACNRSSPRHHRPVSDRYRHHHHHHHRHHHQHYHHYHLHHHNHNHNHQRHHFDDDVSALSVSPRSRRLVSIEGLSVLCFILLSFAETVVSNANAMTDIYDDMQLLRPEAHDYHNHGDCNNHHCRTNYSNYHYGKRGGGRGGGGERGGGGGGGVGERRLPPLWENDVMIGDNPQRRQQQQTRQLQDESSGKAVDDDDVHNHVSSHVSNHVSSDLSSHVSNHFSGHVSSNFGEKERPKEGSQRLGREVELAKRPRQQHTHRIGNHRRASLRFGGNLNKTTRQLEGIVELIELPTHDRLPRQHLQRSASNGSVSVDWSAITSSAEAAAAATSAAAPFHPISSVDVTTSASDGRGRERGRGTGRRGRRSLISGRPTIDDDQKLRRIVEIDGRDVFPWRPRKRAIATSTGQPFSKYEVVDLSLTSDGSLLYYSARFCPGSVGHSSSSSCPISNGLGYVEKLRTAEILAVDDDHDDAARSSPPPPSVAATNPFSRSGSATVVKGRSFAYPWTAVKPLPSPKARQPPAPTPFSAVNSVISFGKNRALLILDVGGISIAVNRNRTPIVPMDVDVTGMGPLTSMAAAAGLDPFLTLGDAADLSHPARTSSSSSSSSSYSKSGSRLFIGTANRGIYTIDLTEPRRIAGADPDPDQRNNSKKKTSVVTPKRLSLSATTTAADSRAEVMTSSSLSLSSSSSSRSPSANFATSDATPLLTWPIFDDNSLSPDGEVLFLSEVDKHVIRRINTSSGEVEVIAGRWREAGHVDGIATTEARMHGPAQLALTSDGCNLFVTEAAGASLRLIALDRPYGRGLQVRTLARWRDKAGRSAIAVSADDKLLYVGIAGGWIVKLSVNKSALHQCLSGSPSASSTMTAATPPPSSLPFRLPSTNTTETTSTTSISAPASSSTTTTGHVSSSSPFSSSSYTHPSSGHVLSSDPSPYHTSKPDERAPGEATTSPITAPGDSKVASPASSAADVATDPDPHAAAQREDQSAAAGPDPHHVASLRSPADVARLVPLMNPDLRSRVKTYEAVIAALAAGLFLTLLTILMMLSYIYVQRSKLQRFNHRRSFSDIGRIR